MAAGSGFSFSTGIGPFQLDRGGGSEHWGYWSTIDKLDPAQSVESVLRYHYNSFGSGSTLSTFAQNSPWYAVNPTQGGNPSGHWNAVTDTSWSSQSNGIASLAWSSIESQLGSNASGTEFLYSSNIRDLGSRVWSIDAADGLTTEAGKQVRFEGSCETWLITARNWSGQALFDYYYTRSNGIEVWVLSNPSDATSAYRYVFIRDYTTGPLPEWGSGNYSGQTLASAALNPVTDTFPPTMDAFSVTPDSVVAGNSFTISYTVSDTGGSGLARVELWEANDFFGTPVGWTQVACNALSGNDHVSGSFVYSLGSVGTYWIGIHVVDNAGNWNDEQNSNTGGVPGDFGPIAVIVLPQQPEISVSGNGLSICTGDTTPTLSDGTDFGMIIQGAAGPTRTFTIANYGPAALTIGTVTCPNGFALVVAPPSTIPPYTSASFSIGLDTSTTGTLVGDVSLSNSDPDESPYTFRIAGTVTTAAPISDFAWQYKANMPRAPGTAASAVVDGHMFVIGGNPRDALNRYDPTTDHWDQLAPVPGNGIDEGGAAVVNGKIYAVGNPFDSFVRIYDPVTNAWTMGAAMPTSRRGSVVVAAGGKVYAIGGCDANFNGFGTVEVYDPTGNTWAPRAPMPTPRGFAVGACVDGLIYVIGGRDDAATGWDAWRTVEVYNPVTDAWTSKARMSTMRVGAGVAVVNGKMYVIGGFNGSQYLASVEEYDPLANSWRLLPSGLLTARGFAGAGVVYGKTYVIGGTGDAGDLSTTEEGTARYLPTVTVSVLDGTASEPSDNGVYRITRTGSTVASLVVAFAAGADANRGVDYRLKKGATEITGNTVTIDAGQSSVDVTVEIIDDAIPEDVEYSTLNLVSTMDYVIGSPNGQSIPIMDNDLPMVTVTAPVPNAAEPSTNGLFRIARAGPTGSSLTVNFNAPTGNATRGTDYRLKKGSTEFTSNSVTIDAGLVYVDVMLEVIDDSTTEATESATLTLAFGTGYTVGAPNSASVSIADDDIPNRPPTVASVSATPNPVGRGCTYKLTAVATDVDGQVTGVAFYVESNGIAGLQTGPGGDSWLGSGIFNGNAWEAVLTAPQMSGEPRQLDIFAQATDDGNAKSPDGVDVRAMLLTVAVPGDTDLDGDVDGDDFVALAVHYTGTGGTGKTWAAGDFDGDGNVDGNDFVALAVNYTGTIESPTASQPPSQLASLAQNEAVTGSMSAPALLMVTGASAVAAPEPKPAALAATAVRPRPTAPLASRTQPLDRWSLPRQAVWLTQTGGPSESPELDLLEPLGMASLPQTWPRQLE